MAQRLVDKTNPDGSNVSYWLVDDQVYRLNEYEPVSFDIYGIPLGARWECSKAFFDRNIHFYD